MQKILMTASEIPIPGCLLHKQPIQGVLRKDTLKKFRKKPLYVYYAAPSVIAYTTPSKKSNSDKLSLIL